MIFEKDEICDDIIKKNILQKDIDINIHIFVKNIIKHFQRCSRDINIIYIQRLLRDSKNNIAFYCIDTDFDINNCPSSIIYQKNITKITDEITNETKDEITYYILLIFTVTKYRNMGYATIMLDKFIKYILKKHTANQKIKFILSSTENAFTFYLYSGFELTQELFADHKILTKYERIEKNKEYYIFELLLN
jgi:hypothetical protein